MEERVLPWRYGLSNPDLWKASMTSKEGILEKIASRE